ncbi:MAG: hypothetical protein WEA09_09465, partial [Gemmatimonadota bacterium]
LRDDAFGGVHEENPVPVVVRIHDNRPAFPRIVMMRGHTGAGGSEEEHEYQGRGAAPRVKAHAAV